MKNTNWLPIESVPLDINVLVKFENGDVIQASFDSKDNFYAVTLPSHGCGCCADQDPLPKYWMNIPE